MVLRVKKSENFHRFRNAAFTRPPLSYDHIAVAFQQFSDGWRLVAFRDPEPEKVLVRVWSEDRTTDLASASLQTFAYFFSLGLNCLFGPVAIHKAELDALRTFADQVHENMRQPLQGIADWQAQTLANPQLNGSHGCWIESARFEPLKRLPQPHRPIFLSQIAEEIRQDLCLEGNVVHGLHQPVKKGQSCS